MKYKTVIVGAGPAGLRCAKILAENDEDFLVLEKSEKIERKICTGLWVFNKRTNYIKLPEEVFERKFRKVVFTTPYKKIEVELETPFVATINRKKLSECMYREIKKLGYEVLFGYNVSEVGKDYVISNKEKIYFDYLVGADGSNSIVRKSLGLKTKFGIGLQYWVKEKFKDVEIHYDAESFGIWYSWVAPHKNITSVGAGCDPSSIPTKKLKENLDNWCKQREINIKDANFEVAPISYEYCGYKFGNRFLIGDAAGFASSLTGGGIYSAMVSGEDVGKIIVNKNYKPRLIEEILKIKKKHDLVTNFLKTNRTLEKVSHDILLFLLKSKLFVKRALEFV
ncbi:MAG: NAD(P)/FAD-dependent oxidoreductase [Candidatus Aenigmatarchaeota archaeon]